MSFKESRNENFRYIIKAGKCDQEVLCKYLDKDQQTSSAQLGSAQRRSILELDFDSISLAQNSQLRGAQLSNSSLTQISLAQKSLKFCPVLKLRYLVFDKIMFQILLSTL